MSLFLYRGEVLFTAVPFFGGPITAVPRYVLSKHSCGTHRTQKRVGNLRTADYRWVDASVCEARGGLHTLI